jgi:hypothetical protein
MHPTETELHDYLDGALSTEAVERMAAHLLACPLCAAEAEELGALKAELLTLPRAIEPERDLRPNIWQRIDDRSVVALPALRTHTLWSQRYRLAAAAVLLVVASSFFTLVWVSRGKGFGSADRAVTNESARLVSRDPATLERQYSDELRELEQVLRKSRGALAPETVRIMEDNLMIIDRAIREARAAMAADPNSELLVELLRSAYERKLELLRQAAKTSPVT